MSHDSDEYSSLGVLKERCKMPGLTGIVSIHKLTGDSFIKTIWYVRIQRIENDGQLGKAIHHPFSKYEDAADVYNRLAGYK
jgi:hypothetical protein